MKDSLRILNASGKECGIDQFGIQGLQLVTLYTNDNDKLTYIVG